jgi:hypothetical protein
LTITFLKDTNKRLDSKNHWRPFLWHVFVCIPSPAIHDLISKAKQQIIVDHKFNIEFVAGDPFLASCRKKGADVKRLFPERSEKIAGCHQ